MNYPTSLHFLSRGNHEIALLLNGGITEYAKYTWLLYYISSKFLVPPVVVNGCSLKTVEENTSNSPLPYILEVVSRSRTVQTHCRSMPTKYTMHVIILNKQTK